MIKKWVKRIAWLLLIISFALIASIYVFLYTEWGTRKAIHYISSSIDNLTIEKVSGVLANNLVLDGVSLSSETYSLKISQVTMSLEEISLLRQSVNIQGLYLNQSEVVLKESSAPERSDKFVLPEISLPFDLLVNQVQLQSLNIKQSASNLSFDSIQFRASLLKNNLSFNEVFVNSRYGNLKGSIDLKLDQLLDFDAQVDWKSSLDGLDVAGAGTVNGNLTEINVKQEIQSLDLNDFNGDGKLKLNLNLKGEDLQFSLTLDRFNLQGSKANNNKSLSVTNLTVSGSPNNYKANGLAAVTIDGYSTDITIHGKGNLDGATLSTNALTNKTIESKYQAQFSWNKDQNITIDGELLETDISNFEDSMKGIVSGRFNVLIDKLDTEPKILIKKLELEGKLNEVPFNASANGELKDKAFEIFELTARLGNNKISGDALLTQENVNATLNVGCNNLNQILGSLDGEINGEIMLDGAISNPMIKGSLLGQGLRFEETKISKVEIVATEVDEEKFELKAELSDILLDDLKVKKSRAVIKGNWLDNVASVHLESDVFTANTKVENSFNVSESKYVVQMMALNYKDSLLNSSWALDKPTSIIVTDNIDISNTCFLESSSNGKVCIEKYKSSTEQYKANVSNLDLKIFKHFLPSQLEVDGMINGRFEVVPSDPKFRYKGELTIDAGLLKLIDNAEVIYTTPITKALLIAASQKEVHSINLNLELQDRSYLKLDANLNSKSILKAKSSVYFAEARYLSELIPELHKVEGNTNLNIDLEGYWKQPTINMELTHNGLINIKELGSNIENIKVRLNTESVGKYSVSAKAESRNSPITLLGYLYLKNSKDNSWNFVGDIKAKKFTLLENDEINLIVSPDLKVDAAGKQVVVSGDFLVDEGFIKIKEIPVTAQLRSKDVVIVEEVERNDNLKLKIDIRTIIKDKLQIDALGLTGFFAGELNLNNQNKNENLNAYGQLDIKNGKYNAYGQKLDINKGTLLFNGAIDNPRLDVRASRRSNDNSILAGINIAGTPNQLRSSLFSEPDLSDIEIINYLITGNGINEDSQLGQEELMQAAIFFGLSQSSPFFNELKEELGIDVFKLNESATTENSSFEAGKNINQRLYLGYSHGLFNRNGFWLIRYKISNALNLEASYGDNQSIDLIYQIKK